MEKDDENIEFEFVWQEDPPMLVEDPEPSRFILDSNTKLELSENPFYNELVYLYYDILCNTTDNGFKNLRSVCLFIIFAFERLTIKDVKEDWEITQRKMNGIHAEAMFPNQPHFQNEHTFYDEEINIFLAKLRMKNILKGCNIKSAARIFL